MSTAADNHAGTIRQRNRVVALACAGLFAGMVGLAYASVPLYRLFCQVTGYAGTPQVAAANGSQVSSRVIEVRFDANVTPGMSWRFKPAASSARLPLGETTLAFYRAQNTGANTVTGTATFNVTPEWTGQYFNKVECFCFTEQTLKSGESVEMPVSFFVDPAILDEIGDGPLPTITLSYTFFPVEPSGLSAEQPGRTGGS